MAGGQRDGRQKIEQRSTGVLRSLQSIGNETQFAVVYSFPRSVAASQLHAPRGRHDRQHNPALGIHRQRPSPRVQAAGHPRAAHERQRRLRLDVQQALDEWPQLLRRAGSAGAQQGQGWTVRGTCQTQGDGERSGGHFGRRHAAAALVEQAQLRKKPRGL